MGYLHEGHGSLVRKSKSKADITIVSVFVNPTQFSPNEDLASYPRDIERDKKLLKSCGADYLFLPQVSEIYGENFGSFVEVEGITNRLEGEFRPTHFKGVTTIVSILFNCVKPDIAFFGQKDAQQAAVIAKMTRELKFDIKIVVCPIIREPDGLAMSSRNVYLSQGERKDALVLSRSLKLASQMIKAGERNSSVIISAMKKTVTSVDSSKLDYIAVADEETFDPAEKLETGRAYYILIACRIGRTRLIDNIRIRI